MEKEKADKYNSFKEMVLAESAKGNVVVMTIGYTWGLRQGVEIKRGN